MYDTSFSNEKIMRVFQRNSTCVYVRYECDIKDNSESQLIDNKFFE